MDEYIMAKEKEEMNQYIILAKSMVNMIRDLGFELKPGMRILDFGCGKGWLVNAFLQLGYDTYGVDIRETEMLDKGHFRKLDLESYIFPFEDEYFDFVYSTSVLEHAKNTEQCISEMYRVLKPGGISSHGLPSMYRLFESHMLIPLGGVIQGDAWIKLWAFLGLRTKSQKGKNWREVYESNREYIKNGLNYHKYRELKKIIEAEFGNVRIVGREYMDNMPGGAAKLGRKIRLKIYERMVFIFREWHIFMQKSNEKVSSCNVDLIK